MANKKTRALTDDEFAQIIQTIQRGYITANGKKIKPNKIKHKSKGVHFMIKCRSVILRISNKVRKDLQST